VFEIVSREVNKLAVPPWALTALDQPAVPRNFRYEDMILGLGLGRDHVVFATARELPQRVTALCLGLGARARCRGLCANAWPPLSRGRGEREALVLREQAKRRNAGWLRSGRDDPRHLVCRNS